MAFRFARILPFAAVTALAIALGMAASGADSSGEVQVNARVGAVARAKGPASIELNPGESSTLTIQVAANFPWRLSLGASNPAISMNPGELSGSAGGFTAEGNSVAVNFTCDPGAAGTQSSQIQYRIERR